MMSTTGSLGAQGAHQVTHQAASYEAAAPGTGVSVTLVLVLVALVGGLLLLVWSPGARKAAAPFWRFASGHLILRKEGEWDASFRYPAPPPPKGGMLNNVVIPRTRWARIPGWKRMLVRWALVGALALAWWAPGWALATAGLGLVVLLVATYRRLVGEWRDWWCLRVVGRFVEQAAGFLGQDPDTPRDWVACPAPRLEWDAILWPVWLRSRVEHHARLVKALDAIKVPAFRVPLADDDARVELHYPLSLTGGEYDNGSPDQAGKIACTRLEGGDWKHRTDNNKCVVVAYHPARPPRYVRYDQAVNAQFDEHTIPLGQSVPTKKGDEWTPNWVTVPAKDLTPHIVISATTGWCKTTTTNTMLAHVLSKGAFALVNDPKRIGFVSAFGGLDDMVRIASTTDGMIEHYSLFLAEMQRRYALIERYPEIKAHPERYFRQWWLVEDEKGSLTTAIKAAWKKAGGKGTPEALENLKFILWQARAANMHVWTACQQANLDVFVDSDGRDQYMARIASGPQTSSAYRMLFAGARKKVPSKKGRALVTLGIENPEQFQLADISDDDARAFAEMGRKLIAGQDAERAERLERVASGGTSPAADADVPAGTPASVPQPPGDAGAGDTADDTAVEWATDEIFTPSQTRKFSVVAGSGREITISRDNVTLFSVCDPPAGEDSSASAGARPGGDGAALVPADAGEPDTQGDGDEGDELVGNAAAAEFLGMSREAFSQARKRWKRAHGADLPGTTTRPDATPVYSRRALAEWQHQRPRAGNQTDS